MKLKLYKNEFEFGEKKKIIELTDDICIFLETMSKKIVCEIVSYFQDLGEDILNFREKALSSVIFPALLKASKRSTMESYYCDSNNTRHFLDFYVMDELSENIYLIELKRLAYNKKEKFDKFFRDRWIEVNQQINNLKQESVNDYIDSEKNIYGISLSVVVPFFSKENEKKDLQIYVDNIINELNETGDEVHWAYAYCFSDTTLIEDEDFLTWHPFIIFLGQIRIVEQV